MAKLGNITLETKLYYINIKNVTKKQSKCNQNVKKVVAWESVCFSI